MSDTDLLQLVMDGMGWEKKKAQIWFNTQNPLLGGATPNGYELMRGSEKLEKFIRNQLSENLIKTLDEKYFEPQKTRGKV